MEFKANSGKKVEITVEGVIYQRNAIQTRFVKVNDSYLELIKEYVLPLYQRGDIVSISEKIISLCQNRIVKREELKVGILAKTLSKFASHPTTGVGVGEAIKMQYAISKVGRMKVLYAAIVAGFAKLFGKKGVFYEIVGQEVAGLDGFYDHVWSQYRDIGIELPENPSGVCEEIYETFGVSCMIVDANDLGQEILGYSSNLKEKEDILKGLIRDNPAGQGRQCTPFILIRRKYGE